MSFYVLFFLLFLLFKISKIRTDAIAILIVFLLVLLTGIRYNVGTDYGSYVLIFNNITIDNSKIEPLIRVIIIGLRECGFTAQAFFFFGGVLTNIFIFWGIKRYLNDCFDICFAILIFSMNTGFWLFSLNIVRQFMAVSILFWGSKYILDRKLLKYFLVVVFASLFHYSAAFMLFFYYIPKIKVKKSIYIYSLLLMFYISYSIEISDALNMLIRTIDIYNFYGEYSIDSTMEKEGFLYELKICFFICQFLFVLATINIEKLNQRFFLNMLWIDMSLRILLSGVSYMERIRLYFSVFLLVALPICVKNTRFTFPLSMIILFLFACAAMITISNSIYNNTGNSLYDYNLKFLKGM